MIPPSSILAAFHVEACFASSSSAEEEEAYAADKAKISFKHMHCL